MFISSFPTTTGPISDTSRVDFMDGHALEILVQESFLGLSETAVRTIISRDSFCAEEVDIFRAVARWARANQDQNVRGILAEIRLSLLSINVSHE
jgi:BTB/POZ domain-containing protein 9